MKELKILAVLAGAALAGCAGSRDISLRYAPNFPGVPSGTGYAVILEPTQDARDGKDLGVLTGFNAIFKKPPVKAPGQDVPAWVSGSIASELREAGFKTATEGEGLRLETRLKKFRTRAAVEIILEASLHREGKTLFTKEYSGRSPAPFMGGATELEEGFQDAMRQVNVRLVYDIIGKL